MSSQKPEMRGFFFHLFACMLQIISPCFWFGEKFHVWNFNWAQHGTVANIFDIGIEKLKLVFSTLKEPSCDSGNVPYNFLQQNG